MTEAWLCAVLAGRVARLRALAARAETATIAKHLDELDHLAKVGGLVDLGQAARSGDVDAIARATPALAEGHHLIPSQAVLVNLAAIARAEGAAIEVEAMPLILPGDMTVRLAVAIATFMGDALDHGSKALTIGIKLDGNQVVAEVRGTSPASVATLSSAEAAVRRVAGVAIAAALCGCPKAPRAPSYAAIHVDRCVVDAPYTEERTALERRLTDEAAALVEARHDAIDACWKASGFDGNYIFTFVSGGEGGSVQGHDVFGDATTEDCLTAALANPPAPAGSEAAEATCSLVLGSQGPRRITVRDQVVFDAGAAAPETVRDHHAVIRTQADTTVASLWAAVDSARAAGATAIDVGLVEDRLLTHVDVDTRSDAEVSSDPTSEVLWIAGDDVVALPNVNDQEVKFAAADEVTVFTVTVQMGRARVVGATRTILVPARRR